MVSRKRQHEGNDDILSLEVIGYEARLFNPATITDADRQISSIRLPWDDDTEVDRFDCRLLLPRPPTPPSGLQNDDDIDFEEKYACDEERYRDLVQSGAQQAEQKTVKPFVRTVDVASSKKARKDETNESPFVPPKDLLFPGGMIMPSTEKIGLVIEKTADFVFKSGKDAELKIIERSKSTPSMSFLSPNDPLHEYYKYLLYLIRDGLYVPGKDNSEPANDSSDDDDDGSYISPLLLKRKPYPSPMPLRKTSAPLPKPALKRSLALTTDLERLKYLTWYNNFYEQPSPYHPSFIPQVFTPTPKLQSIILEHVEKVISNGFKYEKVIAEEDTQNSKHFDFMSPYYMYYQYMLFTKHSEIAPPAPLSFDILMRTVPTPPKLDTSENVLDDDHIDESDEGVLFRRRLAHETMNRILREKNLK